MKRKADVTKPKRGAPFKGEKPRKRYNFTLDPDVVETGKAYAESTGISLSEVVERGIKMQAHK